MNRTILFKKQIEILTITKKCIVNRDKNHFFRIKEGYFDLFFENQFNLKSELIEIIPTENISPIRFLIVALKNAYNFSNETIYATDAGPLTFEAALNSIDYLIDVLNAERNRISNRTVFYSWQNDRLPSTNRNFIEKCIEAAIKRINIELPYLLTLDKDTRGTPGSPNISDVICHKIESAFCFIADITPVAKNKNKYSSNSNVMYETGYAFSSLGDERVVLINNAHFCNVENLPFDIKTRRVAQYCLSKTSADDDKQKQKDELTNTIYNALKTIANI